MPGRYKLWIITIIVLLVLAFIIAFAPVGNLAQAGFSVQSTFQYSFDEPLVTDTSEFADKANEIKQTVEAAGVTTMYVKLINDRLVEIQTAAVTAEGATEDEQGLTKVLQNSFEGVSGPQIPEPTGQRQPIGKLFNFLAIYRPQLQVKLGLDLQGGAHVVLQCLPQTTMTFASPEDKPLVKEIATEEEEAEATAGYKPSETAASLTEKVRTVLVRNGVTADEIQVEVVSPHLLSVKTRANDEQTADRHQKIIQDFLENNYPNLTIEARPMMTVFVHADTADRVLNIVDRRLYSMGEIREPIIQKQGDDQIIVELPGVKDPKRVLDILRSTALLEFVLTPNRYTDPVPDDNDYSEWRDQTTGEMVPWEVVYHNSERNFTGADLKSNAQVGVGQAGDWVVNFEIKDRRKIAFAQFTREHVGRIMAIVLDSECQMAPVIRTEIAGGRGQISGDMTPEEARDLKLLLNAGALPVPMKVIENRTVSATLGQDTITRSLRAALLAFACVLAFMALYYRVPGLLASIALVMYIMLILAVLVVVKATLTLPGIAGLILSLGLAVDANVIIFERLKEELWNNKTLRTAVETGFDRAWTAILDANVTTLIVAAVLYFLGTSLIKGFAVVLFLGVCVSLFTAVTVTRWLVTMLGNSRWGQNRALYGVRTPTQAQSE